MKGNKKISKTLRWIKGNHLYRKGKIDKQKLREEYKEVPFVLLFWWMGLIFVLSLVAMIVETFFLIFNAGENLYNAKNQIIFIIEILILIIPIIFYLVIRCHITWKYIKIQKNQIKHIIGYISVIFLSLIFIFFYINNLHGEIEKPHINLTNNFIKPYPHFVPVELMMLREQRIQENKIEIKPLE